MALSTAQLSLIEQRVANDAPNPVVAYILWLFLGLLGAHRFYLGSTVSAVIMLILTLSFFGLIVSGIWWLIDAFVIPSMVNGQKVSIRQRMMTELLAHTGASVAEA